jgi:hypothetical protein
MRSVLLVGDHGAFREALAKVLEWEAGFEKVPQAGARASRTGSGCGVSVADVDPRRRLVAATLGRLQITSSGSSASGSTTPPPGAARAPG